MVEPIYRWIKAGLIPSDQTQSALELAEERASSKGWLSFILKLLVLLGVLSLAFGVVFFFAYNWNALGRAFKFITLQVLLVAVFALYFFRAKSAWTAQALLLGGVLVLGTLLAQFGQTYQTGADPWQLFATWALLILPLVLFSRSEVLWLVMVLLINTALTLYLQVNRSLFGVLFLGYHLPWFYLTINAVFLLVMEWLASQSASPVPLLKLTHRWAAQVLGVVVIFILGVMGLEAIWGSSRESNINLLMFMVLMPALFFYYRYLAKDLLLLTAWLLSLIFFVLSMLARAVFDSFDAGGLLLMAISLIVMSTFAVSWLKKTNLVFKQEQSS